MMRRQWVKLLPVLLVAALGAGLQAELSGSTQVAVAAPRERTAPEPDAAPLPRVAAPREEASREVIERPIFFASRRPVPPVPPPTVETRPDPDPPLNFALVGTVLTGSSRTALVKPDKAPTLELLAGQSLEGWTVTSIDPDRIMVRHGGNEQLLGLRDFGSKAQQAAAKMALPPRPTAGAGPGAGATPANAQPPAPPPPPPGPSGALRRQARR